MHSHFRPKKTFKRVIENVCKEDEISPNYNANQTQKRKDDVYKGIPKEETLLYRKPNKASLIHATFLLAFCNTGRNKNRQNISRFCCLGTKKSQHLYTLE